MEPGRVEPLEASGRNERKWFITTVIACFVVFLALSAFIVVKYWVLPGLDSELAKADEEDLGRIMDLVSHRNLISSAVEVPLALSSVVFLACMIRWLLAIGERRRCSIEDGN